MQSLRVKGAPVRAVAVFGVDTGEHWRVLARSGWQAIRLRTATELRERLKRGDFNVVLFFFNKHCRETLGLVEECRMLRRDISCVAVVNEAALRSPEMRHAINRLFFDYLSMPLDVGRLNHALGHAEGFARLAEVACETPKGGAASPLLGKSAALMHALEDISRIARAEAPVLILGESGTGKELAARSIHTRSLRAGAPFVALNMASLPESLVQSELFGHEKGAFTGANARRIGHIEAAHTGTLFLDEIGDTPLPNQASLLRFLQEGVITRVGGGEPVRVDVRVIAATHVDLHQAVRDGRFREDLFFRLHVLTCNLPPLRDRIDDVELLAEHFFQHFRSQHGGHVRGLTQAALRLMREHEWPGNVRELINRMQRAVVMCRGELITPEDLGLDRRQRERSVVTLAEARRIAETGVILSALRETGFNLSATARQLGVSRVTLYRLMEQYHIARPEQPGPISE